MESKDILQKLEEKVDRKLALITSNPQPIKRPGAGFATHPPKGRPKGSKNTHKSNWQPKKWKVDHEMIVLMHIQGKTNIEISKIINRSPMWVSWVINCDHAKEMIERVKNNLSSQDLTEKYDRILNKSVDRLADYISNDDIAKATPGAQVDRAMRAMEMIDKRLSRVVENRTTNNTMVLASEATIDKLTNALLKSDEVSKLHRISNG